MPRTVMQRLRPLTAAARVLTSRNGQVLVPRSESWQDRAWDYFDTIGEIEFAMRYFRNVAERITYFPALASEDPAADPTPIDPTDWTPDPDDPVAKDPPEGLSEADAIAIVDAFQQSMAAHSGGFPSLVGDLVIQVGVVGEGYVAQHEEEGWVVYSASELRKLSGGGYALYDQSDEKYQEVSDPVVRIYEPHPRWRRRAHSSLRAVEAECEELMILSRQVRSTGLSRLHAGGLLLIPDELSFASERGEAGDPTADEFQADLTEALTTPIHDEGAVAAVVPPVVRGPGEVLAQVRLVELSRKLDEVSMKQRGELLTRLANGLDLPAEIITGLADMNHWGAWLVNEQAYLQHADPRIRRILDGLSRAWLPLILAESGVDQSILDRVVLWRDHSDLTGHPNRYDEASGSHDRGALSDAALRREGGFDDTDAPSEDELLRRFIWKHGILPPTSDLPGVGEEGDEEISEEEIPEEEDREPGGPPSPEGPVGPPRFDINDVERPRYAFTFAELDTGRLAAVEQAAMAEIVAVIEAAVDRALEKAGARLRSRLRRERAVIAGLTDVPNSELAARLGRDLLTSWQIREDELLPEDSFNGLIPVLAAIFRRFLTAFAREMTRVGSIASRVAEATERVGEAATYLVSQVRTAAAERLFSPPVEAATLAGEMPGVAVPVGAVRDSMAVLAGDSPGAVPPLGFGGSNAVEEDLGDSDLTMDTYEWIYGPFPRDTFDPHLGLDGIRFEGWDDPALANSQGWPPVARFYPGDHRGCLCSYRRVLTQTRQPSFV